MKLIIAITMCIVILTMTISACMGELDPYSSGVLFNSNEQFHLERLDGLGSIGTNYFKSCIALKVDPTTKEITMVTPEMKIAMYDDPVNINYVKCVNNFLTMNVTYGGGCTTHEFSLFAFTGLAKSYLPVAQLYLSHNANGDACKALVNENITFDLHPFEQHFYDDAPVVLSISLPGNSVASPLHKFLWYPDNSCTYSYRSHYFGEAMVYLSYYAPGDSPVAFPRMAVIVNPKVQFIMPFDYGKAVATELIWLRTNRIVTGFTDEHIQNLERSFQNRQGQYWTFQDSILPYNGWFVYSKDSSGAWGWHDPLFVKSRCGLDVAFTLPSDSIGGLIPAHATGTIPVVSGKTFSISVTGNRIHFERPANATGKAQVKLINPQGQLAASFLVNSSSRIVHHTLQKSLAHGIYQVLYQDGAISYIQKLFITK